MELGGDLVCRVCGARVESDVGMVQHITQKHPEPGISHQGKNHCDNHLLEEMEHIFNFWIWDIFFQQASVVLEVYFWLALLVNVKLSILFWDGHVW